jgi:hypothetical protein
MAERRKDSKGSESEDQLRAFLVEVATDPAALGRFVKDPETSMSEAGVSAEDQAVLRSGNPIAINARLASGPGAGGPAAMMLVVDVAGDDVNVRPLLQQFPQLVQQFPQLVQQLPQLVLQQAPPLVQIQPTLVFPVQSPPVQPPPVGPPPVWPPPVIQWPIHPPPPPPVWPPPVWPPPIWPPPVWPPPPVHHLVIGPPQQIAFPQVHPLVTPGPFGR